jgi:hypothetical protein
LVFLTLLFLPIKYCPKVICSLALFSLYSNQCYAWGFKYSLSQTLCTLGIIQHVLSSYKISKRETLLIFFSERNLGFPFLYFNYVLSILLLNFHNCPSELNSLLKIAKKLSLDLFHYFFLLLSATITGTLLWIFFYRLNWLFYGCILTIASYLEFEFRNFLLQILNNVLVFFYMKGNQSPILYIFYFNVFCSTCIF